MALVSAAGATIMPPSPTPRKPISPSGSDSTCSISMVGISVAVGQQVVHERAGQEVALVVVGGLLVEDLADALGDAAPDLAFDDGRVDDPAAVLDYDVAEDLDRAGAEVDFDHAGVGAARPAASGDALTHEAFVGLEVGVGSRPAAKSDSRWPACAIWARGMALLGTPLGRDHPVEDLEVFGGDLQLGCRRWPEPSP